MQNILMTPSERCFAADLSRYGSVAFKVWYDPMRSISITDRKAFGDSCVIGARKFPAAPALRQGQICIKGKGIPT